jgi:glycosyltransferase involved in cell wall biosynthesis
MGLQIRAQRELGLDSQAVLFNVGQTQERYAEFRIPTKIVSETDGFIAVLKRATRFTKEFNPQVVVSHGYKETIVSSYLSLRLGIPFISTIHGGTESYKGLSAIKSALYLGLAKVLARVIGKGFITPTTDLQNQLGIKGTVISNVSDLSLGENQKFAETFDFPVSAPMIIWVGRLVPVKRIDRAIEAIGILKDSGTTVNLLIVGAGAQQMLAENLTRDLKLESQVKFLGFRKDAGELIGSADLLLLTSESEGLPTVMAEAMTQGIKLVMSELPGISEVLERFPTYPAKLVATQTPREFAEQILAAIGDERKVEHGILQEIRDWFDPLRAAREAKELFVKLTL